jgi:hypothetical protein
MGSSIGEEKAKMSTKLIFMVHNRLGSMPDKLYKLPYAFSTTIGPWVIIDDLVKGGVFLENYPRSPVPRTLEQVEKLTEAQLAYERTEIKLADFATPSLPVGPYPLASPQSADYQQYNISLGANNGFWIESVLMQRLPGPYLEEPWDRRRAYHWSQATTVTAPGNPKPIFSKIDRDYPLGTDGKPMSSGLTVPHPPR